MFLKQSIQYIFIQLRELLQQLSDDEYVQPSRALSEASIGQHVRHIIELFQCLEKGYTSGVVNYDRRKRDIEIENNKETAIFLLKQIYLQLEKPNKELLLETEDQAGDAMLVSIPSNYYRELAYNLEHSIHHMALIRIGVNDVSLIHLPDEFGVAFSTVKYRQQCA